jgi:hypothetical protein
MLQAHSLLWHYLSVAPHVISLILVGILLFRGFRRDYPIFCFYLLFVGLEGVCLYVLDVLPSVSAVSWWIALWVGTIIEGILKFALIGEILRRLLRSWPSVSKLGRNLVSGAGVLLVLVAAVAAAYSAPDTAPWFIGGIHVLFQTIYLAAAGLILSLFIFAASLHIPWERTSFGIALGAGFVWFEHLAMWALVAGGIVRNDPRIDLANMAAYHVTVLVWCYYLLVPHEATRPVTTPKSAVAPSLATHEHGKVLDLWNRELERLIHQ